MADNSTPPGTEDPRVRLAAERTLLAWIRTGLAMMGFGFVVARFGLFLHELAAAQQLGQSAYGGLSLWIGSGLVLLGVAVNVLAALEHFDFLRRLRHGEPLRVPRWSLGLVVAVLLALLGLGMVAYLMHLAH